MGPDGKLWFGEPFSNRIGRFSTAGELKEFALPARCFVARLAAGPGGRVWFTDPVGNRIGSITPEGVVALFALPAPESGPAGIAFGADGNLWFTEIQDRIGSGA